MVKFPVDCSPFFNDCGVHWPSSFPMTLTLRLLEILSSNYRYDPSRFSGAPPTKPLNSPPFFPPVTNQRPNRALVVLIDSTGRAIRQRFFRCFDRPARPQSSFHPIQRCLVGMFPGPIAFFPLRDTSFVPASLTSWSFTLFAWSRYSFLLA